MKKVALLMGSETDRPLMEAALPYLEYFGLPYQVQVLSAHRSPEQVAQFAASAEEQGYGVLIAGAGMAAHLAGALKAHSILPVIGVPLPGGLADGLDALLSTVQMPKGVPVATVSVGKAGAINAAVLAAEILALGDAELRERLKAYKARGSVLP
ncbi:MAG: 5-(carboxyamino)imidazole ribonucleotide mutase [Candidatus Marinimicrobia bacterium]|nr:5-(carboxyamino)imidazole ribonucleotide mutase [Candidatus Neomarinimicrobiota bacterium]MCH7938709.1 5-(carboxyamino)imidazole ribonucleotide mutase [Candidatus Neomarinimicrobiota bacterium]